MPHAIGIVAPVWRVTMTAKTFLRIAFNRRSLFASGVIRILFGLDVDHFQVRSLGVKNRHFDISKRGRIPVGGERSGDITVRADEIDSALRKNRDFLAV